MISMIIWVLAIGASISGLIITASTQMYSIHMAIAAVVAVFIALSASQDYKNAMAGGAGQAELASINVRHMGLVWAWGALVIVITYSLVLEWNAWPLFFGVLMAASGLCLFLSRILMGEAQRPEGDQVTMRLTRYLTMAQLAAMSGLMIGLLAAGKMTKYMHHNYADWAASNVFFFGALAIAAISWTALHADEKQIALSKA